MPETAASTVPPPSDTASKVRAEMARRRVRGSTIAAELGISAQQVSARLHGHVQFTVDQLVIVARVLGVPAAELLP